MFICLTTEPTPNNANIVGEVTIATASKIQAITATSFDAIPLIVLIVVIIAHINVSGTNKIPKKKFLKLQKQ